MKNIALIILFGITLIVVANAASVFILVGLDGDCIFSPAIQNINVGDTVTWIWESNNHNVVSGSNCSPDDQFTSGPSLNNTGSSFSFQFNSTGTFPYYCSPHCTIGMVGSIVVSNSPATLAPTPAPYPDGPTAYDGEFTLYNSASSFSLGALASSSASSFLLLSFPDTSIIQFTNVLPGQRLSTPGTIQYSFSVTSITTTSFLFVAMAGNVMSNVANVTLTLYPSSTIYTSSSSSASSSASSSPSSSSSSSSPSSSSSGEQTTSATEYATSTSNSTRDPDEEFKGYLIRFGYVVLVTVGACSVPVIFCVIMHYKNKKKGEFAKLEEEKEGNSNM